MTDIPGLIERLRGMVEFYGGRAASPAPISMTDMGEFERDEIKRAVSEAADALSRLSEDLEKAKVINHEWATANEHLRASASSARQEALEEAATVLDAEAVACRARGEAYDAGEWDNAAEMVRALKDKGE